MIIRGIIYIVLFAVLFGLFHKFQVTYAYSDIKDYLGVLLGVSSMVFTLMGIWIAFIYPNALQRLVDPDRIKSADFSETLSETKRLESLVGSILKASFVVIMIMFIFLTKLIISSFSLSPEIIIIIKYALLSFVVFLSILQLESILYVIYSNIMFVNDLHKKREDREADADI